MRWALVLILCAGCAVHVPTWQRATLMSPVMTDPLDGGEAAFAAHVLTTREGIGGASVGEGAACGCN